MKNKFSFLVLIMMLVGFNAISTTSIFAQATPELCTPIYDKYIANRKGPELDKFKVAVATAKEYLEKCKDLPENEAVNTYVTKDIPKLEVKISDLEYDLNVFKPFDASVKAKDWAKSFSLGKQIIAKSPDDVDVPLILASIGFDNAIAVPPVDTFNAETINMAKLALQKMEQGKGSGTGKFGAYAYTYQTKDCADGKTNATGWMNYTIGYIMFNRMSQKKDGLPFLYKATQFGCETKNDWGIYRAIGSWYVEETAAMEKTRQEKIKANADQENEETKAMYALQKGYTERAIDAYSRAYKIALAAPMGKGKKDSEGYYNRLKSLYTFRFDGTNPTGLDQFIADQVAKPFPNPTTPVTPIVEAPPATGTNSTMTTMTNDAPATATDTRPRTAPTTGAKPTTSAKPTTAPTTAAATTTAPAKKAPAKKPAPKKKGTR